MSVLPEVSEKHSVLTPHFPDPFLTVIWRNWNKVDPSVIAKILDAEIDDIRDSAELLGLDRSGDFDPVWTKRGYITLIRQN